jgi:hypothetical protein
MSVVFDGLSEMASWALILFMGCSFEAGTIGYAGLENTSPGQFHRQNGALERSAFKSFQVFNVWFRVATAQVGKSPKWSCRTFIRSKTAPQASKQVSSGQPLLQCSTDRGKLSLHTPPRPTDTSEPATPCQLRSKKHTSPSCGPPGRPNRSYV